MKTFTQETAKSDLMAKFVTKGIFQEADIQAKITEIAGSIPPSIRADYDADDTIAAAQYYDVWAGENAAPVVGMDTQVAVAGGAVATTLTAPVLSDAQNKIIDSILEDGLNSRMHMTANSTVVGFLLRREKPSEYLAGMKVIPVCAPEKLEEYRSQLVQTEENIKHFEEVVAAIDNTEMPVYVNDKSFTIDGYRVERPSEAEGAAQVMSDDMSEALLIGFLTSKTLGKLQSVKNGIGCEIRSVKGVKSKGPRATAAPTVGAPRLSWVGKTDALKEDYDKVAIITTEYVKDEQQKVVKKDKSLAIDRFFMIEVPATEPGGKARTRKIRLRGKGLVPVRRRKEEFVGVVGTLSNEKIIPTSFTEEAIAESMDLIAEIIRYAEAGQLQKGAKSYGADFMNIVKKVDGAESTGADTASDYE